MNTLRSPGIAVPVVKAEGLSKEYAIGVCRRGPGTLREALAGALAGPFRRRRKVPGTGSEREMFYALKDVSFEAAASEVLGIIGRNGAGKSTLLKILSRITEPTAGRVELCGRVSSLLEVGTGFHPELTGRENVFLNGAILGMKQAEIREKFDEIVAFSEVERFIDTPVKRYSSGMFVRLAFSVAAHLEPEILVVDEVLAVGDASFQRKCLGKMEATGREGRTVLFVSHNMGAVRSLCDRVVWLEDGKVRLIGDAGHVVDAYLQQSLRAGSAADIPAILRALPPDPDVRLEGIEIRQKGRRCDVVLNGLPVEIEIRYAVLRRTKGLRVFFDLCDDERNILIRSFHDDDADRAWVAEPGAYLSTATIPADLLAPKTYELRLFGTIYNVRSIPPGGVGIPFPVEANNGLNRAYPQEPIRSKLHPRIAWSTRLAPEPPVEGGGVP